MATRYVDDVVAVVRSNIPAAALRLSRHAATAVAFAELVITL